MTRLFVWLATLAMTTGAFAAERILKPDFAYPKTVLKSADSLYEVSVRTGDALGQLEALMLSAESNALIDRDSRPESIKRVMTVASGLKDRQMRALFDVYAANLLSNYYGSNRWRFNSRNLPLTPRPADMSEWSGEMFVAVVDSLCQSAWANAGNMPLASLTRVVEADRLTLQYFATLSDFVASNVENICASEELSERIAAESMLKARADSPRYYYLLGQQMLSAGKSNVDYANAFMNAKNKYNALVLWQYVGVGINGANDVEEQKTLLAAVDRALKVGRRSWAEPLLKNLEKSLLLKKASMSINSLVASDSPAEIAISGAHNIDTLTLAVRRYADYQSWRKAKASLTTLRAASTRRLDYVINGVADTTLKIELAPGYYIITADGLSGQMDVMASPFVPVDTYSGVGRYLTVADATTGRPAPGVTASLMQNGKTKWKGTTDADGRVAIPNDRKGTLVLAKGAVSLMYDFMDYRVFNTDRSQKRNIRAAVATDLSVVNPGDSIRWVAALGDNDKMCEALGLNVILVNAEGRSVDTTHVVTDAFGRVAGSFLVPADSKAGNFNIHLQSADKELFLGDRATFAVADFKLSGVRLSDMKTIPDGTTVAVSGIVANYSGTGLAGSEVEVRLMADTTLVQSTLSGSDGAFEVMFDVPEGTRWCTAYVSATAPDGATASTSASFDAKYPARLLLPYLEYAEVVDALTIDAVVVGADGDSIKTSLSYKLLCDEKVVQKGDIESGAGIRIPVGADIVPDVYVLEVAPIDTALCAPQSTRLTIYRTDTAKLPVDKPIFMPADTLVGVSGTTWLTMVYSTENGDCRFVSRELSGGYHNLYDVFDFGDVDYGKDVILFAVLNGRTYEHRVPVKKRNDDAIKVTLESFRDKVVSGTKESWTVRVTDAKGQGVSAAVVVNVYDSRIEQLRAPAALRFTLWRPNRYPLSVTSSVFNSYGFFKQDITPDEAETVEVPQWRWCSATFGISPYPRLYGTSNRLNTMAVRKESASVSASGNSAINQAGGALLDDMEVVEEETADDRGGDATSFCDVELRTDDKYSALWQPMLTTAADGRLSVPFDVPNTSTSWQMLVSAWTKDGSNGVAKRSFISTKPVTVALNAPQFVRAGDEVTVQALLVNTTDAEREVDVQLESVAGASASDVYTRKVTLSARGNTVLPIAVKVPVVADSIRFVVRAVSGNNTDGEAVKLAVLSSQSRVTESRNFYLNPGQDSWSAEVPAPNGSDFSAELSYTGNPMWTVVSSLPALTDDALPTAGSQARAYFGAAVTLSLMNEHPELELQYSKSDVKRIMNNARKVLSDLQNGDGGWMWGSWSSQSSAHVTADVLDVMATLKRAGMLDDKRMEDMIARALPYYDAVVRDSDIRYVITRSAFAAPAMSLNGRKVLNVTIQHINKDWKTFEIGTKALAACALDYTGNKSMARTLLGSIDQFGTQTADKGFEFKNVRSLQTYAWLLESYGAIAPKSQILDGIRQYLIVRRQGEAWGNGVLTTAVVASMINSGTPWTVPAGKVTVSVDGVDTIPAMSDKLGTFDIALHGKSVELTRADAATPAYGALVTCYTAPSADVKAFTDGEISIEKKFNVQDADGSWRAFDPSTDTLRVGQTVRTLLIVKADRPMSRVVVTDRRAATFIPVIQLSGWVFGDGIRAYYENRTSATNLYMEYVPKGTWMLRYDFTVNNAGVYNSGVAEATCSEAPTLTAHSSGCLLRVER